MYKEIISKQGQTIIDIAVEHTGDVDNILNIIDLNDIKTLSDLSGEQTHLDEELVDGQIIMIDEDWINKKVTQNMNQILATAKI